MSLITYEFNRADNAGEISQFRATLPIIQEHYIGKNEPVLYLSGKLNINGVDIDGLIMKEDAIVLIEFKNYSGVIKAQVNGDWFHDNKRINGGAKKKDGSFKTVFEQLSINRRALRDGLQKYIKNPDACNNIQALVVFTSISDLHLDEDFKWGRNAWVNVTDVKGIGEELDTIKAKNHKGAPIVITPKEIFNFIRAKGLDERYIMTKYSDTNIMPEDLFHDDKEHNGDECSPRVELRNVKAENAKIKVALHEAVETLEKMMNKMNEMAEEKDHIIQQQKATLLLIRAELLEKRKLQADKSDVGSESNSIESEEKAIVQEIDSVEKEMREKVESPSIEPHQIKSTPKKRFGMGQKVLKEFNVEANSMDKDQLDLIERNLDKSMIIAGCAGSGKSVIAMHKAQQIADDGGDVILIAYTKSLNRYMSQGNENTLGTRFFYHWQWKDKGMPKADYVIVDEIQDFDKEEVLQFIRAANKCFFFFGDTAQSIYKPFGKKTMTIEDISRMTNVNVSYLYSNYRLPKPVARITQNHLGLDQANDSVSEYTDSLYLSKENYLPVFIKCDSKQDQVKRIISLIHENNYRNVGILVPENEMVLEIMGLFTNENFACEFKYNAGYNDSSNKDTLNFKTKFPKLMTYHSAKGLQFETVILPYYQGANTTDERKALYVAMTRTYRYLYIIYSGALSDPLKKVPERLYNTK